MRVSPNQPNPPRPPAPPEDDGQPLGAFPRGDGRDELRVTLKAFEGRPYVALRLWSRDGRGQFRPVPGKGVSVRLGEVAGVIDALQGAFAAAGELDRQRRPTRPGAGGLSADNGMETDSRGGHPGGAGHEAAGTGPGFVDRGRPDRPDWRAANLPRIGADGGPAGFDECGAGPSDTAGLGGKGRMSGMSDDTRGREGRSFPAKQDTNRKGPGAS